MDPTIKTRDNPHGVDPLFIHRRSLRAMRDEIMSEEELIPLFEAARFSPSSSNKQPWHFYFCRRSESTFADALAALKPGNTPWCQKASFLIALTAKTYDPPPLSSPTYAFDAGAAWMSFALEGTKRGYVVHAMAGFEMEKVNEAFDIPSHEEIMTVIAVGYLDHPDTLPSPYKEREKDLSPRRPLSEMITKR